MTFEKTLIKVDKFGTKTYSSQRYCVRCGGAGGHNMWPGFTCFRCGGSGIDPTPELVKEYTPERRAQLDAINERRRAKKHAEFLAKVPQINAEYCEKHGLNGEFIYIPKGNTFEIKDELKEMGCKFNRGLGWYRNSPIENIDCYKLKTADLMHETHDGLMELKYEDDLRDMLNELKAADNHSEYVGEIGEREEFILTINSIRTVDSYYGYCDLYNLSDEDENEFVYIGTVKLGHPQDTVCVRATIKNHKEYNGIKQTYINRPKVV